MFHPPRSFSLPLAHSLGARRNGGARGQLSLGGDTTGGTARIEIFGDGAGDSTNGFLDINGHTPPGVTIGSIVPGSGPHPGTLTFLKALTFNAPATYKADLNSGTITADQVVAKGVTINSGATITVTDLGTTVLISGTVFTIISNTATTASVGTFRNLADSSTLIIGNNSYWVSYEGGDGNDLTLMVQ